MLDHDDFLQSPRIQSLQLKAEESQKDDDKKRFLIALAREIIQNLSEVTVSNLSDGVNVNNLDEIKASLRNELNKANKPVIDILKELSDKISALKLDVTLPTPQVTVNPTPVNTHESTVNIPALDLEPIISTLDDNLKILKNNNKSNPLAVRLTDGGNWIKGLSDKPSTIVDGSKNVLIAGERVSLVDKSTPCKYVIITALDTNKNSVHVGGSTVSSGRGLPLKPLQSEKIDINDLSKIYIDANTNGDGVTFLCVS